MTLNMQMTDEGYGLNLGIMDIDIAEIPGDIPPGKFYVCGFTEEAIPGYVGRSMPFRWCLREAQQSYIPFHVGIYTGKKQEMIGCWAENRPFKPESPQVIYDRLIEDLFAQYRDLPEPLTDKIIGEICRVLPETDPIFWKEIEVLYDTFRD